MEVKLNTGKEVQKHTMKTLFVYLLFFYVIWSIKELWLVTYIQLLDEKISAILTAIIKISVWIVPAWLYVKYYLNASPMEYFKLNVNVKKGFVWGVLLSLLLGLYFAVQVYMIEGRTFNFSLSLNSYLNVFLLVGITEELMFRGLILQELNKRWAFWKANLISAFLFLIVHYAIWIDKGIFFDVWGQVYVFLVGLIFVFVYKKTGSLWSVVILHSFHNLFVSII
jgi:uncharacterized protein